MMEWYHKYLAETQKEVEKGAHPGFSKAEFGALERTFLHLGNATYEPLFLCLVMNRISAQDRCRYENASWPSASVLSHVSIEILSCEELF